MLTLTNRMSILSALIATTGATAFGEGDLQDLLDQYAHVDQIVLTASVQINIDRPGVDGFCCPLAAEAGEVVEGSFAYLADGDKWRMDSYLDPTKYPGMNTTILYDSAQFAYQALDASILSIQTGPPPSALGMMLLNPAFESVQFLFPLVESNEGTQVQLAEVKSTAASVSLGTVQWTSVLVEGKSLDRTEFPGATYNGVAYTHHVYTKSNAHDRPLIIDRVDAAGGVITRTRLSHYDDVISSTGSTSSWPRSVVWQVFDPNDGGLVAEISMVIDGVIINQPAAFAAGVFDPEALPPVGTVVIDGVVQP